MRQNLILDFYRLIRSILEWEVLTKVVIIAHYLKQEILRHQRKAEHAAFSHMPI